MATEEFPWILRQPVFYKGENIARGLNKIQVNPLRVGSIGYEPVKRGLFDRKGLYFVLLKDEQDVGIGHLFAKVNYSRRGSENGQPSTREDSLSSQFRHLDFLNSLRLPVVEVVGYHSEIKGTDEDYSVLLMKKFQSPTMDRDIIALDKLRAEQVSIIGNLCNSSEERDKATAVVKELSGLRKDLILSALSAVNHVSIYGTFYSADRGDLAYEPADNYFINKLGRRLRLFLLHTLVKTGVIDREDIDKPSKIVDAKFDKLKEFTKPFGLVERLMRDERTMAYTHGDEYPHHFYLETNGGIHGHEIDLLGTKAKLFDFSFCVLNSLIRSKIALLGSPILGLSFGDAQRLFLESQKEALEIAKELKGDGKLDRLMSGFKDEKFSLKMFSLLYLYEQFIHLGLIAYDSLHNPYFRRESNLDTKYEPSIPALQKYIREREEMGGILNVSLERYNPDNTSKIIRANLEECLLIQGQEFSGEEGELFVAVRKCIDYLDRPTYVDYQSDPPPHIHNHTDTPQLDHEGNRPLGFSPVADTQELPRVESK